MAPQLNKLRCWGCRMAENIPLQPDSVSTDVGKQIQYLLTLQQKGGFFYGFTDFF